MSHIVFVDLSFFGMKAVLYAKRYNARVTLIRSDKFCEVYDIPEHKDIMNMIDNIVTIKDPSNIGELRDAMTIINNGHKVDCAISFHEFSLLSLSSVCEELGILSTKSIGVWNSKDKSKTRRILSESGIRNIRSHVVTSPADVLELVDEIKYPFVLKPANGVGSSLVRVIKNESELFSFFENSLEEYNNINQAYRSDVDITKMLMEEYISGELYSVEIAMRGNEFYRLMVSERKRDNVNEAIELGTTMPANLSAEMMGKCFGYVEDILRAVDLGIGIFHVEIIICNNEPVLVEINPRIMGASLPTLYEKATGNNLYDLLVRLFLGKEISLQTHKIPRYVTSRVICPVTDAIISESLSDDWIDLVEKNSVEYRIKILPGERVYKTVSNFQSLGYFQVSGPDYKSSITMADKMVGDISSMIGIKLL